MTDRIVTFDLETKGEKFWEALAPWSPDFEVQIAAWSHGRSGKVKAEHVEDDVQFLTWFEREVADADVIWGWNLVYDIACVLAVAQRNQDWYNYDALRKRLFTKRYSDGMLLWQRTTEMWRTFAKNELFERWTPALSYGLKAYADEHNWVYTEKGLYITRIRQARCGLHAQGHYQRRYQPTEQPDQRLQARV